MGKIFCILGKSSSGKDTIYKRILEYEELGLKTLVLYTTRPLRLGEVNGREYWFVTKEQMEEYQREQKIIEMREYHTMYGEWYYFTIKDDQINLKEYNYLMHTTLESYENLMKYYGEENLVPLYIEVEDGIRLERALKRERKQDNPKYAEMCRRFLADERDFSEENIKRCNIQKRFQNINLEKCLEEILNFMKERMGKNGYSGT